MDELNPEPSLPAAAGTLNPSADTVRGPIAALSTLRTEKPRDFFRTVAELGIQAAEALEHAHQMGIVHRDIKPSNVMIELVQSPRSKVQGHRHSTLDLGPRTLDAPATDQRLPAAAGPLTTPKLWITDFGLAHIESDLGATALTMTGDLLGTLRYMSPEQAEGKSAILDHRSDIYSLGVTLYELLTLRPAFPAADRQTLLKQISQDEPAPPRKLNKNIPADLETIILKAIAKDPRDRYASAADLAADLWHFLDQKPIWARRPSWKQQVWKWSYRHSTATISASLMIILAVAVCVAVWVRRIREIDDITQSVRESLAGARAAIEAKDLAVAQRKVAEAVEQIGENEHRLVALSFDVKSLQAELDARSEDIHQFQEFLKLTNERTVENLVFNGGGLRDVQQALAIYRVLGDLNWTDELANKWVDSPEPFYGDDIEQALARRQATTSLGWTGGLNSTSLTADERRDVREIAYRLLLLLADHAMRWRKDHRTNWPMHPRRTAVQSLAYLEIASSFHEPTRALYWVRYRCHEAMRNGISAAADQKQMQEMPPEILLDYFLPAWDAGWHSEREKIVENLHAALLLEPANYPLQSYLARDVVSYYSDRAWKSASTGQYPHAIADCDKALAIDPQSSAAYVSRGYARWHSTDRTERKTAAADLQEAIRLDPRNAWARATLATLCSKDDSPFRNLLRAIEHAKQAVSLSPTTPICWTSLAEASYKLTDSGLSDYDAAIAAAEEANRLGPSGANYFILALAHWKRGDNQIARQYYTQAVTWMESKEPHNRDLVIWRRDAEALGIKTE